VLEHLRQCGGAPIGPGLSPWECRAAQSRQARPEEAREPSWGAAQWGGGASSHPYPSPYNPNVSSTLWLGRPLTMSLRLKAAKP